VPEIAEKIGVPKILEGTIVEKTAFVSTMLPRMEISVSPLDGPFW
jgi:hypothetical protein